VFYRRRAFEQKCAYGVYQGLGCRGGSIWRIVVHRYTDYHTTYAKRKPTHSLRPFPILLSLVDDDLQLRYHAQVADQTDGRMRPRPGSSIVPSRLCSTRSSLTRFDSREARTSGQSVGAITGSHRLDATAARRQRDLPIYCESLAPKRYEGAICLRRSMPGVAPYPSQFREVR